MMDISCGLRSQPITHAQTTNADLASMSQFNQTEFSILIIQHDAHVIDFVNLLVPVLGHNFLNFYSIFSTSVRKNMHFKFF